MYKGNRSYRNNGATQRKFGTVFLTCVVLGAASFVRAETYYYVGGKTSEAFAAAANWATEDGTVCGSDPAADGPGNTFIFTNDTDVVFTEDVSVSTHIVKKGTGKLVFGNADLNIAGGKLTLESGYFAHGESTLKYTKPGLLQISDSFSLEVAGGAEKYFYIYGDGEEASHRNIVIPSYRELTPAAGTNLTFYLSAIPADSDYKLTLKGAENSVTRFSADYGSPMKDGHTYTLAWNPGFSTATLEIVNRMFNLNKAQSTYVLAVESGVLRFGENAGVKALDGGITVADGATLEIGEDAAQDTFGCAVTIASGGKLRISRGCFKPAGGITFAGEALADGRYRSTDFTWLEGDGMLVVGDVTDPGEPETVEALWTGAGTDDLLTNAGNWEGETLPDFSDGSLVATFASGTSARVPDGMTVGFKGIVVTVPSFRLTGGDSSLARIGSSGISIGANDDGGAVFTNDCPTLIVRDQTWSAPALTYTNVWTRPVSADWPTLRKLTLYGGRNFILSSNPGLCSVNYDSMLHIYADHALGGRLSVARQTGAANKVAICYDVTLSNKFATVVDNDGVGRYNLVFMGGGTNVFLGEVSANQANGHYWRFSDDSKISASLSDESLKAVFKGGYTSASDGDTAHFSPYYNGIVAIEETPMSVTRIYVGQPRYYRNVLDLNVASNTTTRGIHVMPYSVLNTTVADALYATDDGQSGVLLNDHATWNLSADQGVNVFCGIGETATVASSSGATLHLRDDRLNTVKPTENQILESGESVSEVSLCGEKAQTNKAVFAGNVNFSKEGVLDHWMEGASTSSGSVSVKGGRLVFSTGSWRNASEVRVGGSGRIEIGNKSAFDRETPFVFEGDDTDGMLVIPAGMLLKLKNVTVNGKVINGTYSTGLVAGGGTLMAGDTGFTVLIR